MEQIHVFSWNSLDIWKDNRGFVIQAFDKLMNDTGTPIQVQLEGFKPFFRLKISKTCSRSEIDCFFQKCKMKMRGLESR